MNFFVKLYNNFIDTLAKSIADHMIAEASRQKWLHDNRLAVHRAKAIAMIENPEKVNDFKYIKQQVTSNFF